MKKRFLAVATAGLALALCLKKIDSTASTSTPATSPPAVMSADHCYNDFIGDNGKLLKDHFDSAAAAACLNDNEGAMVPEKVAGLHADGIVTIPDMGDVTALIAIYDGDNPIDAQVLKVGQFDRPTRTSRAAPTGDPIEQNASYVYGRDAGSSRLAV